MADEAKPRKTSAAHEKAKAAARAKRLEKAKRKTKPGKGAKADADAKAGKGVPSNVGAGAGPRTRSGEGHRGDERSARAHGGRRNADGNAPRKRDASPSRAAGQKGRFDRKRPERADGPARRERRAGRPVEAAPAVPSRSGLSCPVERECGACQLLGVPYEDQLAEKEGRMRELFAPFADDATVFNPICGMERPLYYRDKVMTPYAPGRVVRPGDDARGQGFGGRAAKGSGRPKGAAGKRARREAAPRREILCGMYAAGTHRIVPTDECLLENQTAKRILLTIRQLMPKFRIEPYDEDALSGFLRHAVVRVGHESGEVLVTLVTNGETFPGSRNFARELVERCPEITTVVQNVNTQNTNAVLGHEGERTLYGPGFILDTLCGLSFRISSHSFYQVNSGQTEVLYRRTVELARLTGGETVLDAYCGTGTIGLAAACGAEGVHVVGVDNVSSAIEDARENARHNGVDGVEFAVADAGDFMQELALRGERVDVLLMDPPRAGASDAFLRAVSALRPARVVYVSCNPDTQARDVEFLRRAGWRLAEVQPVDMFPHTRHVENVCLLTAE